MIVSGGDEELRNLPVIQICANREVSRRSERAEHQEHIVFLDKAARQIQRSRRIGFVVIGDEANLTAVDPAALVDHLEICRLGFSNRPEELQTPAIGHDVADANFSIGHAGIAHALGDRAQ
jgi:hypothetical protein